MTTDQLVASHQSAVASLSPQSTDKSAVGDGLMTHD